MLNPKHKGREIDNIFLDLTDSPRSSEIVISTSFSPLVRLLATGMNISLDRSITNTLTSASSQQSQRRSSSAASSQ
jgi:hypothetical protein